MSRVDARAPGSPGALHPKLVGLLLSACLAPAPSACRSSDAETRPEKSQVKTADVRAGDPAARKVPARLSTLDVDHGELDTLAPADSPKLAATVIASTVYKLPNTDSRRLGYIRLGGVVQRDPDRVEGKGCKSDWYRIYPMGYVCTDEATTQIESPLVRAASRRPNLSKPLPYQYGFVRATAPQYLRIPKRGEQLKSEFQLEEHLKWFAENRSEVQRVDLGANDVPLDERGIPKKGLAQPADFRLSTLLGPNEVFGGAPENTLPFWLSDGKRSIPNVSGFIVPEYAVFADRIRRKTGLSFIDAFETEDAGLTRRFAVTVDLRLIPTTKVKPDSGSPFHGVELSEKFPIPFAWVNRTEVMTYELVKGRDEARPAEPIPRRAIVPLTGQARIEQGQRFYQSLKDPTRWLKARDLGIVAPPPEWPEAAVRGEKWIDISVAQQTLVLYEGKRPFYATLISSGRDRYGDPKDTLATPLGDFELRSKHIAAAMDSQENSSVAGGTRANTSRTLSPDAAATVARLKAAEAAGEALSAEDQRRLQNVKKGRDPEYGVTVRRGSDDFELRDVPWIQYFASGYAIHGAYWHDVFGIPRSHGCVNLSPVDARVVFLWSDPPVPQGWHGINVGEDMGRGTAVHVRK